jgi:hypothetical protein
VNAAFAQPCPPHIEKRKPIQNFIGEFKSRSRIVTADVPENTGALRAKDVASCATARIFGLTRWVTGGFQWQTVVFELIEDGGG